MKIEFKNEYKMYRPTPAFRAKKPYEKFLGEYKSAFGNEDLALTIEQTISQNEELNHGKDKKVFPFPNLDNYVIAYLYNIPKRSVFEPLRETRVDFEKYNFSQPIASNGYDILIMRRVRGVANSVRDYHKACEYICQNDCATRDMAQEFLSKLRLFKDFPQNSYDEFAKKLKYLSDEGQFIDCVNPNNLLIDTENKEFNLIDLFPPELNQLAHQLSNSLDEPIGTGLYDMIGLLLEPRLQPYYLEKMSGEEREETKEITRGVIEKCIKAANAQRLALKGDYVAKIYEYLSENDPTINGNFSRRYGEFLKMYHLA